jgi:hypothetical protein
MSLARPSLPLAPFALLVAPLAVSLARPTLAQEKDGAPLRLAPVLFDDFKSAAPQDPAFLAEAAARDAADLAACQHVPRPAGQPSPKSTTTAAALRASLDAQVVYDAVHGDVWAAGAGWKARFGADGVEYVPRLGKAAPQNFPTRFDLARVTVGGAELALRTPHVARTADGVALDHGSVREIYHVAPEFLEQTFVFDTLPAAADIVVDIAVESAWAVVPGADLIRFVHPTWGEVTYGRAYVLDAAGARAEIHREWTGDGIRLVVPASFVAGAVLPLTIDPIIGGSLMNNQGTVDDDSNVDVAWDQSSQQLWFVWQDYTSATDADIFVASFDAAGTIAAALAIDLSADYWETPAIAASPTTQRVMVVASATIDGPGTSVADITGRIVDTATRLARRAVRRRHPVPELRAPRCRRQLGHAGEHCRLLCGLRARVLADRPRHPRARRQPGRHVPDYSDLALEQLLRQRLRAGDLEEPRRRVADRRLLERRLDPRHGRRRPGARR